MSLTQKNLASVVEKTVQSAKVVDFHTHLFTPCHGELCWWGIDDLLTYHYLVAETFRYVDMPYDKFWALSKTAQAELVWKILFVDRTPISESCRGVITCLNRLGLDHRTKDIRTLRRYYNGFTAGKFIDKIFSLGRIEAVYMTNDPLDPAEREVWLRGHREDPRFRKALRIDGFFRNSEYTREILAKDSLPVEATLNDKSCVSLRKFFENWCDRIHPEYIAASLAPDFAYPSENPYGRILSKIVLPIARERKLPVALMIGVRRLVNPALRMAGDGLGRADIRAVENICLENPDIRFFCTLLARENQHELCITARKFRNLTVFGCWWFMNNPSIIEEITRERLELLGWSIIPQHSDCRVVDQLLYKWEHSRAILGKVLTEKYSDLLNSGYKLKPEQIKQDVTALFSGNVTALLKR